MAAEGGGGTPTTVRRRWRLQVTGVVQGVGFRPFVHRLAVDLGLSGTVGNNEAGVAIDVEGDEDHLVAFRAGLQADAPALARIDSITVTEATTAGTIAGFTIESSASGGGGRAQIPPDVGVCAACQAEVTDPKDRRFRHPFANCTDCGPRYTVVRDLPYDRMATTMAGFPMCAACAAEYADPSDRRHHAQPVSCPECGPRIRFEDGRGPTVTGTDAVLAAVHATLAADGTVAIKGLGGYHLVCDATSAGAVSRLRGRKRRGDKPFAVLVPDLAAARELADLGPEEVAALCSPARPIVLARRWRDAPLAEAVAPGIALVGLLLAYTPLHLLLFELVPGSSVAPPRFLVATSGNRADEPICFEDDEARDRLAPLVDAFCTHDRPIVAPCDDSVVRVVDARVQPVRRARGYAPLPVALPVEVRPTLAVGGDLKNTFCVAMGRQAWMSPHLGDMANLETLEAFERGVEAFGHMLGVRPVVVAVDGHPGYLGRRWAMERFGTAVVEVQHHHAHVAALMVEHGMGEDDRVIGVAFDGTGHGRAPDGTAEAWGGEVLVAGYDDAERVGHLRPLPLPGGDGAVRNPCRVAVAWLYALGIDAGPALPSVAACDAPERAVVRRQVDQRVGCVSTTSVGRLFDVVASVLGVRQRAGYEAQAAMELEARAERGRTGAARLAFGLDEDGIIDPAPLLADLVTAVSAGRPAVDDLALAFHHALADVVVASVNRVVTGRRGLPVALTGGVFQNAIVTTLTRRRLEDEGCVVLTHHVVPPNDGGLALGQAVVAGRTNRQRGA